ncbi:MAG: hypothetical protein J7L12_00130 [Desulfurococcales archaeon]|nr:hypothetical protein [Desulfurococcales archaeon]
MRALAAVLAVMLIVAVYAPATCHGSLGANSYNNSETAFKAITGSFPSIIFPLRDLVSAQENGSILTLFSMSGILNKLIYVSKSGKIIKVVFNESIIKSDTKVNLLERSSMRYCETTYSGYYVKSKIMSKEATEIVVSARVLQGNKAVIHSVYVKGGAEDVTVVLSMKVYPPLNAVIQFPKRGVVLDFGGLSVIVWSLSEVDVNVSVSSRSDLEVTFFCHGAPEGSYVKLVLALSRTIGDAAQRVDNIQNSLQSLLDRSQRFFEDSFIKYIPRFSSTDDILTQVYWYSVISRLNLVSLKGITREGIHQEVIDLWSSAVMAPYINCNQFRSSVSIGITEYITKLVKNKIRAVDELTLLSMAVQHLYESGVIQDRAAKSMFIILDSKLRSLIDATLSNRSLQYTLNYFPYLGEGNYSIVYGLLAYAASVMAELAKNLGYDQSYYINAFIKLKERIERDFYTGDHYVYAVLKNGRVIDGGIYSVCTSILGLINPPHIKKHLNYVSNVLDGVDLSSISKLIPLITYALAQSDRPDDAYFIITRLFMKLAMSETAEPALLPLCDHLILNKLAGISIDRHTLLITPSVPAAVKHMEISNLKQAGKVLRVTIEGVGNMIRSVYVNGIALGVPAIDLQSLPDYSEVVVELEEPRTSVFIVKVVTEDGKPLEGVTVKVLLNNSRKLVSLTNYLGEAYFEVPEGSEATVYLTYNNITVAMRSQVTSKEQEVVINLPQTIYPAKLQGAYNISVLVDKIYQLRKELKFQSDRIGRLELVNANLTKSVSELREALNTTKVYVWVVLALSLVAITANLISLLRTKVTAAKEREVIEGKNKVIRGEHGG